MRASRIGQNMTIGGRTVRQAIDTYAPQWYRGKPAGTVPVRRVTFTDGTTEEYDIDADVSVQGYADALPAGNVASRHVGAPHKARVSDGRWRGEGGDEHAGMRHINFVATVNMFDQRRVNGRVGISN